MEKLLIALKKNLPGVWRLIEFVNGAVFGVFFGKTFHSNTLQVLSSFDYNRYHFRLLEDDDLNELHAMLQKQPPGQFEFFKPHPFDRKTLKRLHRNPAFLMLGVFDGNNLAGYFFLRCFANKKCFTGRIVDTAYQGQGISKQMGRILHHIAWRSGFRVFGTASRDNTWSVRSYQSINNFRIIRELGNNFMLIEYLETEEKKN